MPDIVITEFMDAAAVARLKTRWEVLEDPGLADRQSSIPDVLGEAKALIVRNRTQVTAELLDAGPNLKVVGRLGVGLDNIDLDACKARNIAVRPAVGGNAASVAEYVIMATLMLRRTALAAHAGTIRGTWPRAAISASGHEIGGAKIGIVGLNSIGHEVAWRAAALGMTVLGVDPYLPDDAPAWETAERRDLAAMLAEADVISLHCPLTEQTRGLIGPAALDAVRPGAILINTARGEVIDLPAVADALKDGRLGGAAIDVFPSEPLSADDASIFDGLENVLLTPHVAGVTAEANVRVSDIIADAVLDALSQNG